MNEINVLEENYHGAKLLNYIASEQILQNYDNYSEKYKKVFEFALENSIILDEKLNKIINPLLN